jgi:hypothetical protein
MYFIERGNFMITIEKALTIYTDIINNGEEVNLNYFKNNLSKNDYNEFSNSIKSINLCKSLVVTKKFNKIFEKINNYKEELYPSSSISNFRSNNSSNVNKECNELEDKINKIFEEEFEDE